MIKVIRGNEVSPGIWEYCVPSLGIAGRSRQPLLDACRQIKSLGGDPEDRAGVFREGREVADLSCRVEVGAGLTVSETSRGIGFVPYREFAGIPA